MIKIHTIAAGGGSLVHFDGSCFHVGPDSAGSFPGPACYRQGGPLTITDCNVMLGKLHGRFFPKVFGEQGQAPIDEEIVKVKLTALTQQVNQALGRSYLPTDVAEGFIQVAVANMANAIKKISVQRGYDITEYTLCCFGAAAGQHACLVAESLGIKNIFIPAQAGVLSALGIGLAEVRSLHEKTIGANLHPGLELEDSLEALEQQGRDELYQQQVSVVSAHRKVQVRYAGTDTGLWVKFSTCDNMKQSFTRTHQQRYGFVRTDQTLMVEAISVEVVGMANPLEEILRPSQKEPQNLPQPLDQVHMVSHGHAYATPVYRREELPCGFKLTGPTILIEETNTIIVEPHWQVEIISHQDIMLSHHASLKSEPVLHTSRPDPIRLEIFNHLFMSIAEQMGATLENTAYSVNIKERLDFSCAIFDSQGQLVANAPHIPIHLGSMGDSVQAVIQEGIDLHPGDVFMLNDPYRGGTHLPDITVITPVFDLSPCSPKVLFYVASRGHHADIGGLTPGSMPPQSQTLEEEGIVIRTCKLVDQGQLQEDGLRSLLGSGPYPVRNVEQNLADLRAQIAANATGVQALHNMISHFGREVVQAYMQHVQDHAQTCIEHLLTTLTSGTFRYELDQGAVIQVQISIDPSQKMATIDFTGTSLQQANNFNAPISVCKAAILYVFRTLLSKEILLNAGCLKPLRLILPEGSLLHPAYPAAVVAGNVETSQYIVDTLYGALGIMAASQGTMNNFTFGNEEYQYYETLCGGSGAGPGFHGTSAVQTHMTNSRLTDPEVLEGRFPVLLESFSIRDGSGGLGHFHGGNGVVRKIRFREAMTASILSSHRRIPPYGMSGGSPGKVGKNWVQRIDGTREDLAGTAMVYMQAGEILVIETPGGGGYGTPSDESVSILR